MWITLNKSRFKKIYIKFLILSLILISCSSEGALKVTEATVLPDPYTIIDFNCSSAVNFLVIENNHVIVKFLGNSTGYIYRLNADNKSFESTANSYASCDSNLSAGGWINSYAGGNLSKEPNWESVKLNLKYCMDFYC